MQAQATGQGEPQLDPNGDPHDTIIALLRGAEPARSANDPSELNISPVDRSAAGASTAAPPIDPALRTTPLNDVVSPADVTPLNDNLRIDQPRASRTRRGGGVVRFLLTVCAGVAATIGWQAYGDEVLQRSANLVPQLLGSAPAQATSVAENAAPVQAAAAEPATEPASAQAAAPAPAEQPAAAAAPPAAVSVPAQAAIPVEVTQSIEAMSREIASLKQTIDQLKDGQEKLGRDLAKAIEQEPRKKTAAAPAPKPTTTSSPPPQRALAPPPPQAAALPRSSAPYPPPPQPYYAQGAAPRDVYSPPPRTQLPPEPGYIPAPRPPRPLP